MHPTSVAPPRPCPQCGAYIATSDRCPYCGHRVPDPRIGAVLDDRYRVDKLIAEGGYGRVYKGTHLMLGGPVAIKFLLAQWASQSAERERFRREAELLVKLRHPGTVLALDVGELGDEPYLVMEYVEGTPLSHLVVVGGRTLPLPRIVAIVDQVLQVLEAMHVHGVIHRDLKPDNILLFNVGDNNEYIKLLDFGLALRQDPTGNMRLTAGNLVVGTPIYMAPEQAAGKDVDPSCDIYALGVILYELLAGAPPFMSDNPTSIMAKHLYVDPPPMRERGLRQTVPPAFEEVARRALAKSPGDRPTAAAMRRALAEALAGLDPLSLQQKAAQERRLVAALTRSERALAQPEPVAPSPSDQETTLPRLALPKGDLTAEATSGRPLVLIWGLDLERQENLRTSLALHGLSAHAWRDEAPPPAVLDGRAVKAVLTAGAASVDRATALQALPEGSRIPLLVIDVPGSEEVPALIRAGVSDAALVGTEDAQICLKMVRLAKRGR